MRHLINLFESFTSPFASWRRWWGNSHTGEIITVPSGQEHDNFAEENIELFLSEAEINHLLNTYGEWWEDCDPWLETLYRDGWAAILWDGSNQSLMLRLDERSTPAVLRSLTLKVAKQVPVTSVYIDAHDGKTTYQLTGRELQTFLKRGMLPKIVTEKVSDLHINSGWTTIAGRAVMSDIRLWENPTNGEFVSALEQCPCMDGDPNLRGLAHQGKVYVWNAELSTHAGVLEALGLYERTVEVAWAGHEKQFDYNNPAFCFFMVYGEKWKENRDNPIVVSYNGHGNNIEVLKTSGARRWRNVSYRNGGAFMG